MGRGVADQFQPGVVLVRDDRQPAVGRDPVAGVEQLVADLAGQGRLGQTRANRCRHFSHRPPPRKNPYRQKTPGQNPRTKTLQIIEREFVQEAFVRVFCTRPTKNRGRSCEESITFFTYSYCMGGQRLWGWTQWKVTDASDARGNRKGGREERPTVESYRCLRRAW